MDMGQFRNTAIEGWLRGDSAQLIELIKRNSLNESEREFVARIVSGDVPKRAAGRKRNSRKPVRAGLIRFWHRDVDAWKEPDAIYKAVEVILGISRTGVRKNFKQLDRPETLGQAEMAYFFQFELRKRQVAVSTGNPELIDIYRAMDLKPIPKN